MDEFIKESFSINSFPQWTCPTCMRGILEVVGELKAEETAETLNSHDHPGFDYEWVNYTVLGTLKCNNSRCSEKVVMSGTGRQEEACYIAPNGEYKEMSYFIIKPIFMHPPINIFSVNQTVPKKISQMLVKSFALFFCDDNACGNRIRATLEVMLDVLEVPDKCDNGNFMPLAKRLEKINDISLPLKNKLTALRLLGNAATHGEGLLCRKDNVDAYKLLAHVFDKLFPAKENELDVLSASIIQNQGPIR
ncbi:DUF4145 domain-containing protein [Shewanella sp.]|uniref:DUF4145 domain-containing protein n=2 Tax=Shewanella TaxID=22 RepID=UPI002622C4B2|nr:DUF4145 domain-containing protein [Shewanella sp.]